jgi:hypothetical protein
MRPTEPPGPNGPGLTPRQRKILQAIRDSVQRRGYPPSMREIGEAVGLASTSSVSYQLSALQHKGYLHRDVGRPRTVERAALRGCPVGRLTMDPDVMADEALRRPVEDAFAAVRRRLAEVIDEAVGTASLPGRLIPWPPRPRWSRCCRAGTFSLAQPTRPIPTHRPSTAFSHCS